MQLEVIINISHTIIDDNEATFLYFTSSQLAQGRQALLRKSSEFIPRLLQQFQSRNLLRRRNAIGTLVNFNLF